MQDVDAHGTWHMWHGVIVVFAALFCDQSASTFPRRSDLVMVDTTKAGIAFFSSAWRPATPTLLLIGSSIGT